MPGQKISRMFMSLKVGKIEASKHKSAQLAALFLYFPSKNFAEKQVYTLIKCKMHIVNFFQANILIKNNILLLKKFVINIKNKCALLKNCGVTILINGKQCGNFLTKKLFASKDKIISPCLDLIVFFIPIFLSNNRNFFFYLTI